MITIALVRPDGTESADRPPWTGTRIDQDRLRIVGPDVLFRPEPGEYVGYRIYHGALVIAGAPFFADYRTITVGGQPRRWWQRRARRNTGDTVTLADLHLELFADTDRSTTPTPERTTSA